MTGTNNLDFYEHEYRQGLVRIVDDTSSLLRYVGITHKTNALDTDPVWCIYREKLTSFGIVRSEYASGTNTFDKQWSARGVYFGGGVTPFVNSLAVSFDGVNDHVTTPNIAAFDGNISTPFSLSLWVKPNAITGLYGLVSTSAPDVTGRNLFLNAGAANMYIRSGIPGIGVSTSVCFIGGSWIHFVWTYDGSANAAGIKGYANGIPLSTSVILNTYAGGNVQTGGVMYLGTQNPTLGRYYNGTLDEVSVWNRVLTQAEISALYATTKPTDLTQSSAFAALTNWWRVDSSTFPTLIDVASGINGTCVNMASSNYTTDVP